MEFKYRLTYLFSSFIMTLMVIDYWIETLIQLMIQFPMGIFSNSGEVWDLDIIFSSIIEIWWGLGTIELLWTLLILLPYIFYCFNNALISGLYSFEVRKLLLITNRILIGLLSIQAIFIPILTICYAGFAFYYSGNFMTAQISFGSFLDTIVQLSLLVLFAWLIHSINIKSRIIRIILLLTLLWLLGLNTLLFLPLFILFETFSINRRYSIMVSATACHAEYKGSNLFIFVLL